MCVCAIVTATVVGSIPTLTWNKLFPSAGNRIKLRVEFRHLTRNVSKIGQCEGKGVSPN